MSSSSVEEMVLFVSRDPLRRNVFLLLLFSVLYRAMSDLDEGTFNKEMTTLDCIYFAAITQTTVGFGDIHPTSFSSKLACCFHILLSIYWNVVLPLEEARRR